MSFPPTSSPFQNSPSQTPLQNPSTPPPPPPKQPQRSHETLQPAHPPSTPPKESLRSQSGNDMVEATGTGSGRSSAPPSQPLFEQMQPQAPGLEERWIPEILQDKSYYPPPLLVLQRRRRRWCLTAYHRTTDLHALLTNPPLLSALANSHPSATYTSANLEKLLASNKSLATHLLELQSHLSAIRTSTESLLLQHQSLEVSWRKKQSEMDAALDPWSPKALYQRLVGAVAEQEAVCRAVEESFLEEGQRGGGMAGEREVAEWVKRVRAEAGKLEARREARARWDEGRVGGWR
ncbi:uncharacterized protein GIQ15_04237 [Arthroderma uncinatum]|uniref:uncharacterized protein n=1 Tax=Arthroderma uncinatum TaxID=74035 RepID=UPI00144A8231|nr:uncharacterized protein GIQ15_04237 [Arthroderma uncinatum]KAF3481478.1 hypothetical protein GIQ15_04237 [Arthroderma uncinatum]